MSEIYSNICTFIGCVLMLSTLRHIDTHINFMTKVKGSKINILDFAFFSICIIIPIYYLYNINTDIGYKYIILGILLYFIMYIFCAIYHFRKFPYRYKKDKK